MCYPARLLKSLTSPVYAFGAFVKNQVAEFMHGSLLLVHRSASDFVLVYPCGWVRFEICGVSILLYLRGLSLAFLESFVVPNEFEF